MAISRIGAASGVTSCTLPAHQAGDYIFIFAFRDGSLTIPTAPAGWTSTLSNTGNTSGMNFCYKKAASSSEVSGTWTNATTIIAVVYRGVDATTPTGGDKKATGAATNILYDTFVGSSTVGGNWVIGVGGSRSVSTTIENPPTGMSLVINDRDATDECAWHDTNGGYVGTWPATNVSGGVSSNWHTVTSELKKAAVAGEAGNLILTDTKEFIGPAYVLTNVKSAQNYPTGYTDSSGGSNAYKILETATTTVHDIRRNTDPAISAGVPYRAWAQVAPAGRNFVTLRLFDATFTSEASFTIDLTNGSLQNNSYGTDLTGVSAKATALSNGFYRLDIFVTSAAFLGDVTKGFYIDSVGIAKYYSVTVVSAAFTWAGSTVVAKVYRAPVVAGSAALTWTGSAVAIKLFRRVTPVSAAFNWTGSVVSTRKALVASVVSAAFTWTGSVVRLARSYTASVQSAAFTFTGSAVSVARQLRVTAQSASFTWAGSAVRLAATRRVAVVSAAFNFVGSIVSVRRTYLTSVQSAAFQWTGSAVAVRRVLRVAANSNNIQWAGSVVAIGGKNTAVVQPGNFSWNGSPVTLTYTGSGTSPGGGPDDLRRRRR